MTSEKLFGEGVDTEYPYLAECIGERDGDFIVLFSEEDCGTVVWECDSVYELGHYADDWSMAEFNPTTSKVILAP